MLRDRREDRINDVREHWVYIMGEGLLALIVVVVLVWVFV